MQIKIDGKILMWLLTGILIGVLISLSVFYTHTIMSKPEETGGEGNTTIIRIYRRSRQVTTYYYETFYLLDVEHRIYPESIEVQSGSIVTLWLIYHCDIETAGYWNVSLSERLDLRYDLELIVDVPRMPSGCSIRSALVFTSDSDFEATISFDNPNLETWNVGRPLVKVLGVYLGLPSDQNIGTPDIKVAITASITT